MPIDRFTQEEFETFLSQLDYEIISSEEQYSEMTYTLAFDTKVGVVIRSSIQDGIARDTASDSIHLHMVDLTTGNLFIAKLDQLYITRVPGWRDRLQEKLAYLSSLRLSSGDCPKCHTPFQIFLSKTERNFNRYFVKCRSCDAFKWLDQLKPVFFSDSQPAQPATPKLPTQEPELPSSSIDDFLSLDEPIDPSRSTPVVEVVKKANPEQLLVIEADLNTPCRVLAGPGSGKTWSMTERYQYMLQQGAEPDQIVAITFTSKMASELLERITKKYPVPESAAAQICTIHAFCRRLLISSQKVSSSVKIPKDWEIKRLIEAELVKYYKDIELRPLWGETLNWINTAKAHGIDSRDTEAWFASIWQNDFHPRKIAAIRDSLDRWSKQNNYLSFMDMIYLVDKYLKSDPSFIEYCQHRFKYAILDEAQDTNEQCVRIINKIFGNRVTFVGDIDQLLYRFNGATPETNLLEGFETLYPDGQLFFLGTNYRSTKKIVKASRMILYNYEECDGPNSMAYYNEIKPFRQEEGDVSFSSFSDPLEEADAVAQTIKEHLAQHGTQSAEDFFIGMRTRAYSVYYEDILSRNNIPYINTTGMTFWLLPHVEKMLAYIRVGCNFKAEQFNKIYNIPSNSWTCPWRSMDEYGSYMPTRMLSRDFIASYPTFDAALNAFTYGSMERKYFPGHRDIADVLSEVSACNSSEDMVAFLIDKVFRKYLTVDSGLGTDQDGADGGPLDDLYGAMEIARMFPEPNDYLNYVDKLIASAKAAQEKDWSGKVIISTIHKLKGLERPIVFAVGMSEAPDDALYFNSLLPHTFTFTSPPNAGQLPTGGNNPLEDERCLYYVLLTRAKEKAYVFSPLEYRGKSQKQSRFVNETKRFLDL